MKSLESSQKKILLAGTIFLVMINLAGFLILTRNADKKKGS